MRAARAPSGGYTKRSAAIALHLAAKLSGAAVCCHRRQQLCMSTAAAVAALLL